MSVRSLSTQDPLLQSTKSQIPTDGDGVASTSIVDRGVVKDSKMKMSVNKAVVMSTSAKLVLTKKMSVSEKKLSNEPVGEMESTIDGSGNGKDDSGTSRSSELVGVGTTRDDVSLGRGVADEAKIALVGETGWTKLERVSMLTDKVSSEEGRGLSLLSTREELTGREEEMEDESGKEGETVAGVGKSMMVSDIRKVSVKVAVSSCVAEGERVSVVTKDVAVSS